MAFLVRKLIVQLRCYGWRWEEWVLLVHVMHNYFINIYSSEFIAPFMGN